MRRASSPGADGITWREYRHDLNARLALLSQELRDGTWKPHPPKENRRRSFSGKEFLFVIPTVEERIVHRAMRNVIEPILEAHTFLDFVSGYRPGRNRLTSVRQAMAYLASGKSVVADIDVANATGHVTLDEPIDWLADWISDGTFLQSVRQALQALPTPMCPGSGLAPLLINLRLVPVDWALSGLNVVRFADNYCIFCDSIEDAKQAFELLRYLIATRGLGIAHNKSKIRSDANPEDLFLIAG
jgi:hypothetical protein